MKWAGVIWGPHSSGPCYAFEIINQGRRPVTIVACGYILRNSTLYVSPFNPFIAVAPTYIWGDLPKKLDENSSHQLLNDPSGVREAIRKECKTPPKTAYVRMLLVDYIPVGFHKTYGMICGGVRHIGHSGSCGNKDGGLSGPGRGG